MAYLGSTPETQTFTSGTDYFNGDGISVSFTLSRPVASVNDIDVVVSNVVQQPSTAYSVSGTTITFTSAPPAGTANVYARYLSTATQTLTPSPGTVGTSQLSPSLTNVPFFGGSTLGAGNATGMKNRIINGGMVLDQRNAGASVTISTGTFLTDRWNVYLSHTATMTGQQSATAPNGFTNSLAITVGTGAATTSTDQGILRQKIEGFNIADLGWGTVNAKTVTLSFWVRSSLTGTFGVTLRNGTSPNRAYTAAYTISSANTFEYKTIVISGDTTGTWLTDNSSGIQVAYDLGTGTTYSQAAGSWTSNTAISGLLGGVKLAETSGATFYITGVQLEEGNAATSFEFRDYGRELMMCQRYFEKSYDYAQVPGSTVDNTIGGYGIAGNTTLIPTLIYYKVVKRIVGNTFTLYAYDGTSGRVSQYNTTGNTGATGCAANKIGETGVNGIIKTGGTDFIAGNYYWWNWTSSAEL